ncbi:MAG: hypothetical protein J6T99_06400 [Oscillospiraceae bacterium]|nr:hypothetical protein [Oscillospiraceae bacterium]
MSQELYHHGILGMKWGIRRYQNKDGSLTDKGRKRLERSGFKNSNISVSKDQTLYRVSGSDEELGSERKYAALTKGEADIYKKYADLGYLGKEAKENGKIYELSSNRDLKVAQAHDVIEELLSTVGDRKVSEMTNRDVYSYDKKYTKFLSKIGNKTVSDVVFNADKYNRKGQMLYTRRGYGSEATTQMFQAAMANLKDYRVGTKTLGNLSRKGYDIAVDIEDYYSQSWAKTPVIILNPKDSVKKK